jgi:hypothetical protein
VLNYESPSTRHVHIVEYDFIKLELNCVYLPSEYCYVSSCDHVDIETGDEASARANDASEHTGKPPRQRYGFVSYVHEVVQTAEGRFQVCHVLVEERWPELFVFLLLIYGVIYVVNVVASLYVEPACWPVIVVAVVVVATARESY